jgi:hypothetical protein
MFIRGIFDNKDHYLRNENGDEIFFAYLLFRCFEDRGLQYQEVFSKGIIILKFD